MGQLYVNMWTDGDEYFVNIKTFVIFYLYRLVKPDNLQIKVRLMNGKSDEPVIGINGDKLEISKDFPELSYLCTWPMILLDKYVISGMCSVARQIVKCSSDESIRSWLGFRESCLVACAETSVWTKFCEIDIIKSVEDILLHRNQPTICLPENVMKYEHHLSKPVRIHNIYKIARISSNDKSLTSSIPKDKLQIDHNFSEGPYVTLSDVILFPCFQIISRCVDLSSIESKISLTLNWLNRLKLEHNFPDVEWNSDLKLENREIVVPNVQSGSLYKADFTKENSEKHTKQYKIDEAMKLIENVTNLIVNDRVPCGHDIPFQWSNIPIQANPKGGSLPENRADRKCEQLESIAKAVIKIVGHRSYRIVDFCSGSGHLGILLAVLLPNCQIVLVENKERSLARARATINDLNLNNVIVVQTNLDYFEGTFDLGVALHACGVATDLVLQMCVKNKADFVCCPCCYGGVKQCHKLVYPRSEIYQELFIGRRGSYFDLAHGADQTHDEDNAKTEQGYLCMDVIDTDRKLHAQSYGYEVCLGKLQPTTCTNKNNLLVGVFKG